MDIVDMLKESKIGDNFLIKSIKLYMDNNGYSSEWFKCE